MCALDVTTHKGDKKGHTPSLPTDMLAEAMLNEHLYGALYTHPILIFRAPLRSGCHPHFTDEETEAGLELAPKGSSDFTGISASVACTSKAETVFEG